MIRGPLLASTSALQLLAARRYGGAESSLDTDEGMNATKRRPVTLLWRVSADGAQERLQ
jgi:hypothetical protein